MHPDKSSLLTSIVLFGRLSAQSEHNTVHDLIGAFLKAAVAETKTWTLTSKELTDLVNSTYGFQLPEAVVRRTVSNNLNGIISFYDNGHYFVDPRIATSADRLNKEKKAIHEIQQDVHQLLIKFITIRCTDETIPPNRMTIIEAFNQHLLDKYHSGPFTEHITEFIFINRKLPTLTQYLAGVRQGLIIYQALRLTPEPEELYQWKTPLIIFLSIDQLFNSLGYNGPAFETGFADCYSLIHEINDAHKGRGRIPAIQLRYLRETQLEVQRFFDNAAAILEGQFRPDPDDPCRQATERLLAGCTTASDIEYRKLQFEALIGEKNIRLYEFDQHGYNFPEYQLDEFETLNRVNESTQPGSTLPDEARCANFLRVFSIINTLRQEKHERRLEDLRYVLLTNQPLGLSLARSTRVAFHNGQIPFAVDLDFLTNALWGKLKKGIGETPDRMPTTGILVSPSILLPSTPTRPATVQRPQQRLEQWIRSAQQTLIQLPVQEESTKAGQNYENPYWEIEQLTKTNTALQEKLAAATAENKRLLAWKKISEENKAKLAYELTHDDFIDQGWQKAITAFRRDARYAACSMSLSFGSIAITGCLHINFGGSNGAQLALIRNLIVLLGILFSTTEIVNRSYIFDKTRIRNGRRWILAHLPKSKEYRQIRKEVCQKLAAEFIATHPYPATAPTTA